MGSASTAKRPIAVFPTKRATSAGSWAPVSSTFDFPPGVSMVSSVRSAFQESEAAFVPSASATRLPSVFSSSTLPLASFRLTDPSLRISAGSIDASSGAIS